MILKGPGIKEGFKLEENVNLIDLAPTFSHLLDIRQPNQAKGRILYDILEKKKCLIEFLLSFSF